MKNNNNEDRSSERDDIDVRAKAFSDEEHNLLRTHELTEADHHETHNRELKAHDDVVNRKLEDADLIRAIEGDRVKTLRMVRLQLNGEMEEAIEVAKKAFAKLGLVYTEQSTIDDIYAIDGLHASEAAQRAGQAGVFSPQIEGAKVLKAFGMVGCMVLGTVGLGSLVLHVPPRMLLVSPMNLGVAASLSFILVAGSYLMVTPPWRRIGTYKAGKPEDKETKSSTIHGLALTAFATTVVAAVDAKAMTAMNANRALISTSLAQPPVVTFTVALALSAAYVMGSSALAFYEAFAEENQSRIAGVQHRYRADLRTERSICVEIQIACEALSAVQNIKARLKALPQEIKDAQSELNATVGEHFAAIPAPPEMPEEHKRELRILKKLALFANWKAMARKFKPDLSRYGNSGEVQS